MSRRGNCWDNAVAESFFATLKVELVTNDVGPRARTPARRCSSISRCSTTGSGDIPRWAISAPGPSRSSEQQRGDDRHLNPGVYQIGARPGRRGRRARRLLMCAVASGCWVPGAAGVRVWVLRQVAPPTDPPPASGAPDTDSRLVAAFQTPCDWWVVWRGAAAPACSPLVIDSGRVPPRTPRLVWPGGCSFSSTGERRWAGAADSRTAALIFGSRGAGSPSGCPIARAFGRDGTNEGAGVRPTVAP